MDKDMDKNKEEDGHRKIPIKGYVVDSNDGESDHSHKLYISSWDGRPVHVHSFSGTTSFDVGHDHQYVGLTLTAPTGFNMCMDTIQVLRINISEGFRGSPLAHFCKITI
jgi:hypothetical protein